MKDATLIFVLALLVYVAISWASAPSVTFTEHTGRLAAEHQVAVLETRVALLTPTVIRRACGYPYPSC